MTSSELEWPWRGPQKVRRTIGLALVLLGLVGAYVLPAVQWTWHVGAWALILGLLLVLPSAYAWPWRTRYPLLTTIVVAWLIVGSLLFLALQLEGFRGPLLVAYRVSQQAFILLLILFIAWKWGLPWLRRRRQPPGSG